MDYQKLYSKLFNRITDTIEQLKELQVQVEEDYLQLGEENKVIKLRPLKGKTEVPLLSVDDEEYEKLLATLYTAEWQKPVKGLLDEVSIRTVDVTAVQYVGDKFGNVVLFVSNKSSDGKHIISLSPANGKGELSAAEHIAILDNFKSNHKNIRFNRQ